LNGVNVGIYLEKLMNQAIFFFERFSDYPIPNKQKNLKISHAGFIGHFGLHILPRGYTPTVRK
jgi:hypothetical protein